MIYERFGSVVTIVRIATLDDVKTLDKRRPTKGDKFAIEHKSYIVVRWDDGTEHISHIGYLRADEGAVEIDRAIKATGGEL